MESTSSKHTDSKITIKHYLNKRIKPDTNNKYPVYIQVIYKRKVTDIKSLAITEKLSDDAELQTKYHAQVATEQERIRQAVVVTGSVTFEHPNKILFKEQTDLLRTIATDKHRIKELNEARSRISRAIKAVKAKITENETAVYQPYEPTESQPTEEMFRQLELF